MPIIILLLIFGLQLNVMKTLEVILALVLVLIMNGAIVMGQDLKSHQDIKKENAMKALIDGHPRNLSSQQMTGDTIHVSRYAIYMDTVRFSDTSLFGHTDLEVVSKLNGVTTATLSLLQLTIDSISSGGVPLAYNYNDTSIIITLPSMLNINDSVGMKIYYHGHPKRDPSGWGGWYWSGSYAFNIGVGFDAQPHTIGRYWYPCIDEFTDKSLYEFYITCDTGKKAFCNGLLLNTINNNNGTRTYHWKLNEPIPSYLACMAVAPFYILNRTVAGIPVEWAVTTADTAHTLATFINFNAVIANDTSHWGPYRWEKIGYVETPINIGGMEHATAINIGTAFINGMLTYEYLYAHELSHQWFGDMVTCKTPQDMWLNEGWACYNEAFFYQAIYGEKRYRDWIRTTHRNVLQFAHIVDSAYLAINNIPVWHTYDDLNVYKRGADLVRTIRNYMGDTAFFPAVRGYLNDYAFSNANSYDLRDKLTQHSSIDMTRFFDDWIFTPGFPHFSIDSVTSIQNGGSYDVTVYTRQRSKGNNHIYKMPVDITFADGVDSMTTSVFIDTVLNTFHFTLPFNPTWTALDRNEKTAHAVTCYEQPINTTGNFAFPETNVASFIPTNLGAGNNFVRIEHNWVAPDPFKGYNHGIRLSDYHYFKVDGVFSSGFVAKCTFSYNGGTSLSTGYLDNTLINGTEDSLVLLYRANTADEWHPCSHYLFNMGNANDKIGSFTVDTLLKGEYAFGYYDHSVASVFAIGSNVLNDLMVFPNPSTGIVNIKYHLKNGEEGLLRIKDSTGKIVYSVRINSSDDTVIYKARNKAIGTYFVSVEVNGKPVQTKKFIINSHD